MTYKGVEVSYTDTGSGNCILLLHGYLESSKIWKDFVPLLSDQFRVIAMDIPGHGMSGCWGRVHCMSDLAESVKELLDVEGIKKLILVGHSLGGYVSMAFAAAYPERLAGYVLFHSTCFADNDEKKTNREREINLILCGRKRQIINVNIPKAFADSNVERMQKQVMRCQEIAIQNEEHGIISILNGMKNRIDHTATLSDSNLPLLLIGGEKDNYIPMEVFKGLAQLAPHASLLRLKESGHMGFIEEADLSAKALLEFSRSVIA